MLGKSGWNSGKRQKYYKLFETLAIDAYIIRKETQPDVASEQQRDFPDIWLNCDHLQPIQSFHFKSKQTSKNRITEVEDTSLCSLHVKNSVDRTRSYQLGRAQIQLPGSDPTQCGERQEIGPESSTALCA